MTTFYKANFSRILLGLTALAAMTACSVSTAHLTDLTTGTDKAVTTPTSTFAKGDTIYAKTDVANTPSKVTVQFHVIAEKVTGQPANAPIPSLDESVDLATDGTATMTLTPSASGWPTGTYKIEADMMVDGTQKDQKTAEFTVN
jgi:hypothetical protein